MVELKVFNITRPLADVFLSRSLAATVATRVSDAMHAGNVVPSDPVCREDAGIPDYRPWTTTAAKSLVVFRRCRKLTPCTLRCDGISVVPNELLTCVVKW